MEKLFIQPIFVLPSSLIAIVPFRYVWNNPPSFVGQRVWLAVFMAVVAFFIVDVVLSYAMTVCWGLWKSD